MEAPAQPISDRYRADAFALIERNIASQIEAERKAAYRASKQDEYDLGHVPNVPGTSGDSG